MPVSPEVAHHRARHANAIRNGKPEAAAEALRALRAAQAERWVQDAVAKVPELTDEQRVRLARLLFGEIR
jgi:hypothetical protein